MICKAETAISDLTQYVQEYYEQEVSVCPSTDGAVITDDDGEIMPFSYFFGFEK